MRNAIEKVLAPLRPTKNFSPPIFHQILIKVFHRPKFAQKKVFFSPRGSAGGATLSASFCGCMSPVHVMRDFYGGLCDPDGNQFIREVLHGVGADGVGVKFPIFAVNCCCSPLSLRRRGEKRRKTKKNEEKRKKNEKMRKKAKNA